MNKRDIVNKLEVEWPQLIGSYKKLDPGQQALYLHNQGYARFADLVAHFTAWWELAMKVIAIKQKDPAYFFPDINVDEFNAAAVEDAKDLSEEQVLAVFEQTRIKFIECVRNLSEGDLENPNIIKQLEIDVFGHLGEHEIKKT